MSTRTSAFTALRKRFEYVPGEHRPHPVRNGLIFITILGVLAYAAYDKLPFWPEGGRTYKAEFERADYMRPGVEVRVGGVEVGKVEEVERQPDGDGALVTFRITDDDLVIREDARTALYWRTLLGFFYEFELDPGSESAPELAEDAVIPESRSLTQVSVDEAFRPLDDSGRAGIKTFIKEFDKGFEGDGAGETIEGVAPAGKQLEPAMEALGGVAQGDLARLVDRTGEAMGSLGQSEESLATLIESGGTAVAALEAQRSALGSAIQQGPETMAETQQTMTRLRTTLETLDPLARELRPGAQRLDEAALSAGEAVEEAKPLLADLRPLLSDLRPALRELGGASREGTPLIDDFEPTVDRTNSALIPYLEKEYPDSGLKNYEAIGPFFSTVSAGTAQYSSTGHQIHFGPGAGEALLASFLPCATNLTDPTAEEKLACKSFDEFAGEALDPQSGAGELVSAGDAAAGAGGGGAGTTPQTTASGPMKPFAQTLADLIPLGGDR